MVHLVQVRVDAARNRARILEVARALIARDGPSVSMDEIAREAGVAVGTLYRHHPTKAALVAAVVEHSLEQIARAAQGAIDRVSAGSAAGPELAELFRVVARRHASDDAVKAAAAALGAAVPVLDGGSEPRFAPETAEAAAWEAIQELLAHALAEGSVRADLTALDLVALLLGTPSPPIPDQVRDRYIEVVLDGIRRTPPR